MRTQREKARPTFLIALVCFLSFGTLMSVTQDWHDIRGTFLLGRDELATTQGTVVSGEVIEGSRGSRNRKRIWRPRVRYQYTVAGQDYESDELTFADTYFHSQQQAQAFVAERPVGSPVTVHYEKDNPGFAVLNPGVRWRNPGTIGFVIGGLAMVLYQVWKLRRSNSAEQRSPTARVRR